MSPTPVHIWYMPWKRSYLWLACGIFPLVLALILATAPWASWGHHVEGTPSKQEVRILHQQLRIVPQRVTVLGYERSCDSTKACSFGPAWSDNTEDPLGHNGRDTRTDMLLNFTPEIDPYTGDPLPTERRQQHVDHLYPLAAAWDFGAWEWSAEKRSLFANDTQLNLFVVSGRANMQKGDSTPAEWMPRWRAAHCWYAYRYVLVALRYDLAVSQADYQALKRAIRTCPRVAVENS